MTRAEEKARKLVERAEAKGLKATMAVRTEPATYFEDGEVMLQARTIASVNIQETRLPSAFCSSLHAAWMSRHSAKGARASTCFLNGTYWPAMGKSKELTAREIDIWVDVLGVSAREDN